MYNELINNIRQSCKNKTREGCVWTASYRIRFDKYSKKQVASKVLDSIIKKLYKLCNVIFHFSLPLPSSPPCSGSMMLVGAIGSHLTTLVNLALHVADMPIHPMDCTKANTFFDGLRSAVRLSGTEGKMLTLMFTVSSIWVIRALSQT